MKEEKVPSMKGNMPKKIGYRYELVASEENCIMAIREMLKGKKRRAKYAKIFTKNKLKIKKVIAKRVMRKERYDQLAYLRTHEAEVAKCMAADFANDTWIHSPYRTRRIYDNLRGKWRDLKIPCHYDQCMHHAIMRQTVPDILKRKFSAVRYEIEAYMAGFSHKKSGNRIPVLQIF